MAEFSGHLSLQASARENGPTVLSSQSFRAPYHLSKPYWDADTGVLLVQVVNPTAGILAGDQLDSDISVGPGASLLVTTPSASRVFQMKDGTAACRQHFTVARNGWLEVLPEPLVPHRGCNYRQTTRIAVEPGGELFFADLLLPGRVAHGEAWEWKNLCLKTEVRLGGELRPAFHGRLYFLDNGRGAPPFHQRRLRARLEVLQREVVLSPIQRHLMRRGP